MSSDHYTDFSLLRLMIDYAIGISQNHPKLSYALLYLYSDYFRFEGNLNNFLFYSALVFLAWLTRLVILNKVFHKFEHCSQTCYEIKESQTVLRLRQL